MEQLMHRVGISLNCLSKGSFGASIAEALVGELDGRRDTIDGGCAVPCPSPMIA
jgi:hypothetical protein